MSADDDPSPITGEELASEPVPERGELLMASIVRGEVDGMPMDVIELGVWRVPADAGDPACPPEGMVLTAADGEPDHLPGQPSPTLLRPRRPLLLLPEALPAVLALVERALAALPGAGPCKGAGYRQHQRLGGRRDARPRTRPLA